ncbi:MULTISPECIES: ParB N-terminal domain-containing protein [unclassified Streptomyces]|uniref:ParB N-terminal domain-containing protein n=1 Tax=unclassified Streptomyces TaxID=2593676 RepID=UPI00227216D5|nr:MULTISPECIES: ParB N-terminal domain-containing protein [unclassified Streptomyces]MCY0924214.1 ParB N-terminal domain-containing protein [Streptomyces sp. H27-G5]MCY0963246.1 ParB N-terminal domain-containing protein [Streptomyces sp. H27-H5]
MKTSTQTRTAGATPTTVEVTALVAANPLPADLDISALIEDIGAHGIVEPLYVATTEAGAVRVVDGTRRLAAAVALSLTEVPVTYRPLISVSALNAHPGNVRQDLKITDEFLKSITVEGVRTPIVVTRAEGGLRVVDGHRRLAAAVKAKLTHLPYTFEERDDAGQILDMVTTARHRAALTRSEEAAALFDAAALGADVKRIAAAGAVTQVAAKEIKKLAQSDAVRAAAAHRTGNGAPDLEVMAMLAELETDDPQAAAGALAEMDAAPNGNHAWIIRRTRNASRARQAAQAHRAELEKAGAAIRTVGELRDSATRVIALPGITVEKHATCQGHVWALEEGSNAYTAYCTSPELYGHKMPTIVNGSTPKQSAEERRAIRAGNTDWDTADEMRAEWLAALFGRSRRVKGVTDRMTEIIATVMVSGADVVNRRGSHPATRARLCTWMGLPQHTDEKARAAAVAKVPAKATLFTFAAIVAAYEQHVVRTVWRTDGAHAQASVRSETAGYLKWLTGLGYEPTPIERAVIDGKPYKATTETEAKKLS